MIVKDYYNAWASWDEKTLRTLLDDSMFGVRTFYGDVLFDKEQVIAYLMSHKIKGVTFGEITQSSNTFLYQVTIDTDVESILISGKIRTQEGRIQKLYETVTEDLLRYKCVCSYDGSSYYGFQKQDNKPTIQGTIENAIKNALSLEEPISIHGSGRTDKGVHANNQVFHFDIKTSIPVSKMATLINNYVPDSIHIKNVITVDQTFHSRYDIRYKEYKYIINHHAFNPIMRQYEWFVENLEGNLFRSQLQEVIGTHDFQSFTKATTDSTIRTVTNVRIEQNDTHTVIYIKGTGFLRYMVRYIIGAAVQIATGKLETTMNELLKQKDVTILKDMAPASGLYLNDIEYE